MVYGQWCSGCRIHISYVSVAAYAVTCLWLTAAALEAFLYWITWPLTQSGGARELLGDPGDELRNQQQQQHKTQTYNTTTPYMYKGSNTTLKASNGPRLMFARAQQELARKHRL